MNERLSVCIPTFNRAPFLRACLDAFLPQVRPHQIPIFISDNASTDATIQMLEGYRQTTYPHIFVRRNETNRGLDQNMVDVTEMATTEFCWLFGDDDIPNPGAIEKILDCLNGDYRLLVLNGATYNWDLGRQVEPRRMHVRADRDFGPGHHNELLMETGRYISYMGSLVVHLQSWRTVNHEPFIGFDYLHVSVVLRYIVGHRAMLCADPLVKIRLQPTTWMSRYFQVELIHWPRTIWSLPAKHYSAQSKSAVVGEKPTSDIRRIVATRGYGHYDRRVFQQHVAGDSSLRSWRKALYFLIAICPHWPVRAAAIVTMRVARIWRPSSYELALFRLENAKSHAPAGPR